jgi:hypothetical protein
MHDTDLRRMAREGQFMEAVALTEPDDRSVIGDEVLRLLQRGLLLHYAGEYEASNEALQAAEVLIDDRFTKQVSLAVLSLVTSDRALAWLPGDTERLMVNLYGALNYLALGNPEEAAVEARRLSRLLELSEDQAYDPAEARMRRAMRYFAGSVFEAAGESNDAAVAYRHVWSPSEIAAPATSLRPRFLDLYGEGEPVDPAEPGGEVVVLLERGFVAHRVERSLNVPLFPEEADVLHASDPDLRHAAATCVAARGFADVYDFLRLTDQTEVSWHREADGRCVVEGATEGNRDEESDDGSERDFYLMRVAWPEMVRVSPVEGSGIGLSVTAGPALQLAALDAAAAGLPAPTAAPVGSDTSPEFPGVSPALSASVSESVMVEFDDKLGGILIKMVARTALKYELARGIESGLSDKNETLGDIAFFAANAAAAMFERADTRCWHLLPDEMSVVRLRLPAGRFPLSLEVEADGTGSSLVDLGEVEIRNGAVRVLSARVWP